VSTDKTADEIVVEAGLKKRAELDKLYEAEGSNVNPLMLIQIPDSRKGLIDKKDSVVQLLSKYGITTENGRLAIYLSELMDFNTSFDFLQPLRCVSTYRSGFHE